MPGKVKVLKLHAVMVVAASLALALRFLAVVGYPSVLWFGDSTGYVRTALKLEPSVLRPSGYSVLLLVLEPLHSFVAVVTVQHLLGVATGVLLYALVWRHARAAWPDRVWLPGLTGTAVALPVLFDGYQIQLEHMLMSDALFTFLVVAGIVALLWRAEPTWRMGAVAGVTLGMAAATRTIGLPLLAMALLWLVLRRKHFRVAIVPAAAVSVAFAVPVVLYMSWYYEEHGKFAMTGTEKVFLYGRTASFADCSVIQPSRDIAWLCPRPSPHGVSPPYAALWTDQSPFENLEKGKVSGNEVAGEFALDAIASQPLDYAGVVVRDTLRAFYWQRTVHPAPWTFDKYEFPDREQPITGKSGQVTRAYTHSDGPRPVVEPYAGMMRAYQDWVHLPGLGLGALLVAAPVAVALRGTPRRRVLLPWMTVGMLLVVPAATADFDYRYVLPAVPLGALAAGLAFIPRPVTSRGGASDSGLPTAAPQRRPEPARPA